MTKGYRPTGSGKAPDRVEGVGSSVEPTEDFEVFMERFDSIPHDIRSSIYHVTDTAHICKLWFESRHLPFTASDVVAMTRLVMEYSKQTYGE